MTLYPDAQLENADWPKTTWDLPIEPSEYSNWTVERLEDLMRLPVWKQAPPAVKAAIEDRLALDPNSDFEG